jgi:drug/metabolite transporter (DMT)-like permease
MHQVPLTAQRVGGVFIVLCGAFIVRWADARAASLDAAATAAATAAAGAGGGDLESEKESLMKSSTAVDRPASELDDE